MIFALKKSDDTFITLEYAMNAKSLFFSSSREITGGKVLLAGAVSAWCCGVLYIWSVFSLPLEQLYAWDRADSSLVFTLMVTFFALGMGTGGFLLRHTGPRLTGFAGACCLGMGLFAASQIDSYLLFCLCYGVVGGYGAGLANIVPLTVCLRWYSGRAGLVSGTLTGCIALGTLMLSGIAEYLIRSWGVLTALTSLGLSLFVLCCAAVSFLNYPPDYRDDVVEDAGGPGVPLPVMIRIRDFWYLWMWAFCIQLGGLMVVGHIVPYAIEQHISREAAIYAMGTYAVLNGTGRLLFGAMLDKFNHHVSMQLSSALMAAGLCLLLFLPGVFGTVGLLFSTMLIALAFGGTIPQLNIMTMRMFGPRYMGENIGFTATGLMAGAILGPWLGAQARVMTGSYHVPMCLGIIMALVAAFFAVLLRHKISAHHS